jgi:hypothetical protein
MLTLTHTCLCGTPMPNMPTDGQTATCATCSRQWRFDGERGKIIRARVRSFRTEVETK